MSSSPRHILAALAVAVILPGALSLTACGFTPVYGSHSGSEQESVKYALSHTEVAEIPDREGQYLRNALIDRFYLKGRPSDPLYVLTVAPVQEAITDLDITKSSDATRGQLRLDTSFILKSAGGETLLTRKLTSITSYNILSSEFTNRVSEQSARQNALDDLAGQIETLLALYYNGQR